MDLDDKQYNLYLRIARKYATTLPDEKDRVKALKWIQKIHKTTEANAKKTKHHALQLLIICLQRKRLVGPFETGPDEGKTLLEHGWAFQPADIAKLILQQEFDKAGKPPVSIEVSGNVCEFVAYQNIPSFGAHFFYAFSPEHLIKWDNLDESYIPRGLLNVTVLSSPDTSILARSVKEDANRRKDQDKAKTTKGPQAQKKHDQFVDVSVMEPTGEMKEGFVLEEPEAKGVDTGLIGTAIDAGIIKKQDVDPSSSFKAQGDKVKAPHEETVKVQKRGKKIVKKKKKNVIQPVSPVTPMEHWVETHEEFLKRQKQETLCKMPEGLRKRLEKKFIPKDLEEKHPGRDPRAVRTPEIFRTGPRPKHYKIWKPEEFGLTKQEKWQDAINVLKDLEYKSPKKKKTFGRHLFRPPVESEPEPECVAAAEDDPKNKSKEVAEPLERSYRERMDTSDPSPPDPCVLIPRKRVLLQRLEQLKKMQPKRLVFDETDNLEIEPEEVAFERLVYTEFPDEDKEPSILVEDEMQFEDVFGEDQIVSPKDLPAQPEDPALQLLDKAQTLLETEMETNDIFTAEVVEPHVTFKEVNVIEDRVVADDDESCPKAGSVKVTKRIMEIPGEEPIVQTIFEEIEGEPLFDETLKAIDTDHTPPLTDSILNILLDKKLEKLKPGKTPPRTYGPWAAKFQRDLERIERGESLDDDLLIGSDLDTSDIFGEGKTADPRSLVVDQAQRQREDPCFLDNPVEEKLAQSPLKIAPAMPERVDTIASVGHQLGESLKLLEDFDPMVCERETAKRIVEDTDFLEQEGDASLLQEDELCYGDLFNESQIAEPCPMKTIERTPKDQRITPSRVPQKIVQETRRREDRDRLRATRGLPPKIPTGELIAGIGDISREPRGNLICGDELEDSIGEKVAHPPKAPTTPRPPIRRQLFRPLPATPPNVICQPVPTIPQTMARDREKRLQANIRRKMRKLPVPARYEDYQLQPRNEIGPEPDFEARRLELSYGMPNLLELSSGDEEFLREIFGSLSDKSMEDLRRKRKGSFDGSSLDEGILDCLEARAARLRGDPNAPLVPTCMEDPGYLEDDEMEISDVFGESAIASPSKLASPTKVALAKSVQMTMQFNKFQNRLRSLRGLPPLEERKQEDVVKSLIDQQSQLLEPFSFDNIKGVDFGILDEPILEEQQAQPLISTPKKADPFASFERAMDESFERTRGEKGASVVDKGEMLDNFAEGMIAQPQVEHICEAVVLEPYPPPTQQEVFKHLFARMEPVGNLSEESACLVDSDLEQSVYGEPCVRSEEPQQVCPEGAPATSPRRSPPRAVPGREIMPTPIIVCPQEMRPLSPAGPAQQVCPEGTPATSPRRSPPRAAREGEIIPTPIIVCPQEMRPQSSAGPAQDVCPERTPATSPRRISPRRSPPRADIIPNPIIVCPQEMRPQSSAGPAQDVCPDGTPATSPRRITPRRSPPRAVREGEVIPTPIIVCPQEMRPQSSAGPAQDVCPERTPATSPSRTTPRRPSPARGMMLPSPQVYIPANENLPVPIVVAAGEEQSSRIHAQPTLEDRFQAIAAGMPQERLSLTMDPTYLEDLDAIEFPGRELPIEDECEYGDLNYALYMRGDNEEIDKPASQRPISPSPARVTPPRATAPQPICPFPEPIDGPIGNTDDIEPHELGFKWLDNYMPFEQQVQGQVYKPKSPVKTTGVRTIARAKGSGISRWSKKTPGVESNMEIIKESCPGREVLIKRTEMARGTDVERKMAKSKIPPPTTRPTRGAAIPVRRQMPPPIRRPGTAPQGQPPMQSRCVRFQSPQAIPEAAPCPMPTTGPPRARIYAPPKEVQRGQVALTQSGNIRRSVDKTGVTKTMTAVEIGKTKTLAKKATIQVAKDARTGNRSMTKENVMTVKQPGNVNKKEYKFAVKRGPNVGKRC